MHRNKLAILILLIGGFGCRQNAPKVVYVDFEAVLASYKASPLPSHPLPKAPGGLPQQTVSIPAVPARTVVVQGTSGVKAEALLEENRKKAVAELTSVLSRRYEREAQRAGEKRIRELDPKKKTAYLAAQTAIDEEFHKYAQARAPLIAGLTSLVGFPDPNPNSLPPPASTAPFLLKRLQEAASLRKQINALDAAYDSKVLDLLAQAAKEYNVDLAAIQQQVEADRAAGVKRAETEAMAEASKTYSALKPLIMGAAKVELPGQPAQSAVLPPVPPPISAPDVRERTLTASQRRSILESQLQIWLKANGYELSKTPDGVEDMTAEFVKWRQERKL